MSFNLNNVQGTWKNSIIVLNSFLFLFLCFVLSHFFHNEKFSPLVARCVFQFHSDIAMMKLLRLDKCACFFSCDLKTETWKNET